MGASSALDSRSDRDCIRCDRTHRKRNETMVKNIFLTCVSVGASTPPGGSRFYKVTERMTGAAPFVQSRKIQGVGVEGISTYFELCISP